MRTAFSSVTLSPDAMSVIDFLCLWSSLHGFPGDVGENIIEKDRDNEGHFENVLIEGDPGFKSGVSPSKIVIYVQKKLHAKFGAFVPPVTVMWIFGAKPPD